MPGALTGDRHFDRYAHDGRLVVAFRDMAHDTPTYGDWVAWVGTYDDIVCGREGQYRVRLMHNFVGERLGDQKVAGDCGYSALELLPNGTFVATTYGHWREGEMPYIVSVRFMLEEIDVKAAALTKEGVR